MDLKKAYEIFDNIEREINKMSNPYGNMPDEFDHNYDDEEERFKHNQALLIVDRLDDIKRSLDWINKPIIAEGRLYKNSNGRYELEGIEITSGRPIEAWENDYGWIRTRIEHSEDYYIYDLKEQDINNTLVRIR